MATFGVYVCRRVFDVCYFCYHYLFVNKIFYMCCWQLEILVHTTHPKCHICKFATKVLVTLRKSQIVLDVFL